MPETIVDVTETKELPEEVATVIPLILNDTLTTLEDMQHRAKAIEKRTRVHLNLTKRGVFDNGIIYIIENTSKPLDSIHSMFIDAVRIKKQIESVKTQLKDSDIETVDSEYLMSCGEAGKDIAKFLQLESDFDKLIEDISCLIRDHLICTKNVLDKLFEKKQDKDEEKC